MKTITKIVKGAKVKVLEGRNAGCYGTIHRLDNEFVYVIFPGKITTWDGDVYPDEYWVHLRNIELK